jgi:hypothetical protein
MPRIRLKLSIGFQTASHTEYIDYDDADWEAMSSDKQEKVLEEIADEWGSNYIDLSASVVE